MTNADDHFAITDLMMSYCRLIDAHDREGLAQLLWDAEVHSAQGGMHHGRDLLDPNRVRPNAAPEDWPKQKHVTTNVVVDVADDGLTASAHSYYTLLQQREGGLTPVVAGRYEDEFAKVDGEWKFTVRRRIRDLGSL